MKPKVLHLVDTFLSRSETFIYNAVTSHVAFDPVVLCYESANESEFPFSPRVVLPRPITKRNPRWWADEAAARLTGRSLWQRAAEREIARLAPAVMHAHFAQQGYNLLPIARRLRVPLVTNFYGYDMSVLPRLSGWSQKLKRLFAHGDLFLVEGEHMRARVIDLGAAPDKVVVQRIGIDIDKYPRWRPAANEAPIVLFVGRFVEKKGLLSAIAAVVETVRRGEVLRFRIIGDGPERAQAEQLVRDGGIADCTEFLGMRAHADVIEALQLAAVLIHPSRTARNGDSEGGAPTILLEAQAIGTAIVSTTHADIPNVVGSGAGIFLSAERDDVALAANLHDALRRRVGSESGFVIQHHDRRKQIVALERNYARITLTNTEM